MSNRRGWIRLGIALSAIWFLAIFAVAAYEYFMAPQLDTHWFVSYVSGTEPDPEFPRIVWDIPSLKVGLFFQVLFLPLAFGWTLIPSIAWVVSWVRAGFRS